MAVNRTRELTFTIRTCVESKFVTASSCKLLYAVNAQHYHCNMYTVASYMSFLL